MVGVDPFNLAAKVRVPVIRMGVGAANVGPSVVLAHSRYTVIRRKPWTEPDSANEWLMPDPAITGVPRDRAAVVFRVNSALDPGACA
jgi:hypothetical protein